MTTVILKPTDGCNARCRYCSAAHPGASRCMTRATLRRVFKLFADWSEACGRRDITFIWHGGEPLLMPGRFWEEVFAGQDDLIRGRGLRVENRIQTNATRIRRDTLPLLKRLLGPHGTVGTSADPLVGIRELKGAPDGRYRAVLEESMGLLREAGIRYGIVMVVHRLSLPHLAGIYREFRERHPDSGLRFNPLYRQGRAEGEEVWEDLGISAIEWGRALTELYSAWDRDGRPASVQPFSPWQRLHDGGGWRLSCEGSGTCAANHFGVDPNGAVFLCGRSADGQAFRFGSVTDLTAAALQSHPVRRLLDNRRTFLKRTACLGCPWWQYCHGGCPNDAVLGGGSAFTPTTFCAGLRNFFDQAFGAGGGH